MATCALVPWACSIAGKESAFGRNHTLAGRIWESSSGQFVDSKTLYARATRADFVLLGEQHDNPEHHRLQAEVLRGLIALGWRPAVGFEMFSLDQAGAIREHLERTPTDAAGLGHAVNWEKSGWPQWAMYQPIAEAALAAKLPIVATNLPLAVARKMSRAISALDPSTRRELALDRPLSEAMYAAMAEDIRSAHCGYLPEQSIPPMVDVQRARDAQMAQSLIAGATADGAILIAGAGHVRKDYGVPVHLAAKAPGKQVISIAFVEVDDQKQDPQQYLDRYKSDRAVFDYLWFTSRVDNEDPCEKFKSQFQKFKTAQ